MSIADRVREAASLLEVWKGSFYPGCQQAGEAENQMFRFNLWTSNNSIFGSPRTSLDWILRNNPILLFTMEDLLDDLKTSLTARGTAHDGQRSTATNFSTMLEEIEDAINQLFRFSRAIHRSGVEHRFVKLVNYVDYSTSGMNLLEEFIITARQLVEPLLNGKTISHEMEDRLIETICLRRQNFAYIYARKAQQAPRPEESSRSPYLKSALPPISSLTPFSTQTAGVNPAFQSHSFECGENSVPTPMNQEAETLDSYSWFPQPPAVPLGREEWECPYCMQVCPVKEFSRGKWKEHILGDIMPYICVLESCPTPNALFKSMEAWVRHMTNEQMSGNWACVDTRHDTKLVFDSESEFKGHILECHLDQFEEPDLELDLDFLADSCFENKARDTPLTNCPFCPMYSVTKLSSSDLIDHVAQHLLTFARISFEGYFEKGNEQSATSDLTEPNRVASNQGISGSVANGLNFGTALEPELNFNSNLACSISGHTISGYHDLNRDLRSDAHPWGPSDTAMATSVPLGDSLGAFTHARQQLHNKPDEADDDRDDGSDLYHSVSSQSVLLPPNMTWDQPLNMGAGYDPPSRGNYRSSQESTSTTRTLDLSRDPFEIDFLVEKIKNAPVDVVEQFLRSRPGLDIEQLCEGNRPLIHAIESGSADMIYVLWNHKRNLDVKSRSSQQETPLNLAVLKGDFDKVKIIIDILLDHRSNACLNEFSQAGKTPLMEAASNGHVAMVSELLNRGADPTICDDSQLNCLHYAVDNINSKEDLLKSFEGFMEFDHSPPGITGYETPMMRHISHGIDGAYGTLEIDPLWEKKFHVLRNGKADVDRSYPITSPLELAVARNNVQIAEVLLKAGALLPHAEKGTTKEMRRLIKRMRE